MKIHLEKKISDCFQTPIYFNIQKISDNRFAVVDNTYNLTVIQLPQMFVIKIYSFGDYIYGMYYDKNNLKMMIGNGNGEIQVLDENFQFFVKYKIHQDLITNILQVNQNENLIATSSIDTSVKISSKDNREILYSYYLELPIFSLYIFHNEMYIPLPNTETTIIRNYCSSLPEERKSELKLKDIVSISDILYANTWDIDKIVEIQTQKEFEIVACEMLSTFNDNLITLNQDQIGIFIKQKRIWKYIESPFKNGYTYFKVKQVGNYLILAGDIGKIVVLTTGDA